VVEVEGRYEGGRGGEGEEVATNERLKKI